jgi:hypothetical protein
VHGRKRGDAECRGEGDDKRRSTRARIKTRRRVRGKARGKSGDAQGNGGAGGQKPSGVRRLSKYFGGVSRRGLIGPARLALFAPRRLRLEISCARAPVKRMKADSVLFQAAHHNLMGFPWCFWPYVGFALRQKETLNFSLFRASGRLTLILTGVSPLQDSCWISPAYIRCQTTSRLPIHEPEARSPAPASPLSPRLILRLQQD